MIDDESHWPLSFLCSKINLPGFCIHGIVTWLHSCDLCWSIVQWIIKDLVLGLVWVNFLVTPWTLFIRNRGRVKLGGTPTSAIYPNYQKSQPAKERCSVLSLIILLILLRWCGVCGDCGVFWSVLLFNKCLCLSWFHWKMFMSSLVCYIC